MPLTYCIQVWLRNIFFLVGFYYVLFLLIYVFCVPNEAEDKIQLMIKDQ